MTPGKCRTARARIAALACAAIYCLVDPSYRAFDPGEHRATLADPASHHAHQLAIAPVDANPLALFKRSADDVRAFAIHVGVPKRQWSGSRPEAGGPPGATFDRMYAPSRLRRMLIPPSSADPERPA